MSRVLIIHTPSQLEEASSLVDLLEAALPLPEGTLVCSSLPGYAWGQRITAVDSTEGTEAMARFGTLTAAIALVDEVAFADPQLWFDVAAAWARGKRVAVLLDTEGRRAELPRELAGEHAIVRENRAGLVALVEDVAFDLGLAPRIGRDAQRALVQLSTVPPRSADDHTPTVRPRVLSEPPPQEHETYEPIDTVPPPAMTQRDGSGAEDDFEDLADGDAFELDHEDEDEGADESLGLAPDPRVSLVAPLLSCEVAFEAGRAIGECSFHRDSGGDFAAELDIPFGRFIDAVGGNWDELKHLGDVELWLGATDNLLESLAPERRETCEWYEIGFQLSTLCGIGEFGLPADLEQRAAYQELWGQSMIQLRNSAASARVAPREIRRLQALLETLIGPEHKRDYGAVGRALAELRALAAAADRGALPVGATG
jgi:hypothetical protein